MPLARRRPRGVSNGEMGGVSDTGRILVTGAAGLIGSAVVWELNRQGIEDVIAVDHLGSSEKWRNLRALRFREYVEKGDFYPLLERGALPWSLAAILHLGACSDTTQTDATYLVRNNVDCSKALALLAARLGVRFVYASSAATYGDGALGFRDEAAGIEALRPLNPYGYSKQLFDLWLKREGLLARCAGLKYSNVFGPNEAHKAQMRSVVMRAFEQVRDTGVVRLFRSYRPDYADGEQERDFLYVKDAAAMSVWFLQHPEANGLFNVGSGVARTWNDLAGAVLQAMGAPHRVEYIDMPVELRGRYQYHTCLDQTRTLAAGCPAPLWGLEAAVADYVRSYLIPGRHLGDEELDAGRG